MNIKAWKDMQTKSMLQKYVLQLLTVNSYHYQFRDDDTYQVTILNINIPLLK